MDNETAKRFLMEHRAYKEHISISDADLWLGSEKGVIGMTFGKKTDRIKAFYVSKEFRGQGIGSMLLKEILLHRRASRVTAFATEDSVMLFERAGMNRISQNKNGIYFMEGYYG